MLQVDVQEDVQDGSVPASLSSSVRAALLNQLPVDLGTAARTAIDKANGSSLQVPDSIMLYPACICIVAEASCANVAACRCACAVCSRAGLHQPVQRVRPCDVCRRISYVQ